MRKRTLEQAFNAVFHKKSSFQEFCSLDIAQELDLKEKMYKHEREILCPLGKHKKYLRFIDRIILRHLNSDLEVVHSFIKEKNTLSAVEAHIGNNYFFLTDIISFYSNIKPNDVRKIIERDKNSIPISDIESYVELIVRNTTYNGSVPVGFSTSPQLSNAFLFDFDRVTKSFCSSNSLIYTRYADDIIISGKSFDDLSELRIKIQNFLVEYASPNIQLNQKKTHITHLGNKINILGLSILPNGIITINSKYKKRIELVLHFYINNKEKYNSLLSKYFRNGEHSLFGLLHYAKSIDPKYIAKLQRKYGAYTLHTLMERQNDH